MFRKKNANSSALIFISEKQISKFLFDICYVMYLCFGRISITMKQQHKNK